MDKMPIQIKRILRKIDKANKESQELNQELFGLLDEYGIDYDVLVAVDSNEDVRTEALAFINNAEGNIEDNIKEIEKVFLYYVNKQTQ